MAKFESQLPATVQETDVVKATVGSNPTPSAMFLTLCCAVSCRVFKFPKKGE